MKKLFVVIIVISLFISFASAVSVPLGQWSLDEGSGTVVNDSIGSHNGTISGATWISDGVSGSALYFDGNDVVQIMFDVPEYNFTIEFWAKTQSQGTMFSVQDEGNDRHIGTNSSGNPYIRVWSGGGWTITTQNAADNEWHHWALTVESGVGQKVYLDGVLVGTYSYDHSDFNWQDRIYLGYGQDLEYFTGSLDEVAYYGTVLSQEDILANINAVNIPEINTVMLLSLGIFLIIFKIK